MEVSATDSSAELSPDCLGAALFADVTNRWSILILAALANGPLRFHALRDALAGVTEKMLAQNLKTLVRDGLVQRQVEGPAHVSYALSDMGVDLDGHFRRLREWIGASLPGVQQAQTRFDAAKRPPGVIRHRLT